MIKCNKCNERAIYHFGDNHICWKHFNLPHNTIDSASNNDEIGAEVPLSLKNSSCVQKSDKNDEISNHLKNEIQEMINEVIETTSVPLSEQAYSRLSVRIEMDSLKQKIKQNISRNIREL